MTFRGFLAVFAYLASIVAANWLTNTYGLVGVGFGLLATAGTVMAGLAFVARDAVQDTAGRRVALIALAVGVGLSLVVSSPHLALASGAAFGLSELADMLVYTPLRRRGYIRAAIASNLVGAVVDTFVFLWLAGFPVSLPTVGGQLVGKAWATLAAVCAAGVGIALLRYRQRAQSS